MKIYTGHTEYNRIERGLECALFTAEKCRVCRERLAFFDDVFRARIRTMKFVENLNSQLPDSFYGDFLIMLFMAIDIKQQIGYQSSKNLNRKAMLASCN